MGKKEKRDRDRAGTSKRFVLLSSFLICWSSSDELICLCDVLILLFVGMSPAILVSLKQKNQQNEICKKGMHLLNDSRRKIRKRQEMWWRLKVCCLQREVWFGQSFVYISIWLFFLQSQVKVMRRLQNVLKWSKEMQRSLCQALGLNLGGSTLRNERMTKWQS